MKAKTTKKVARKSNLEPISAGITARIESARPKGVTAALKKAYAASKKPIQDDRIPIRPPDPFFLQLDRKVKFIPGTLLKDTAENRKALQAEKEERQGIEIRKALHERELVTTAQQMEGAKQALAKWLEALTHPAGEFEKRVQGILNNLMNGNETQVRRCSKRLCQSYPTMPEPIAQWISYFGKKG